MGYVFKQGEHMHHGYDENGHDIESTTYRLQEAPRWVMFVDGDVLRELLPSDRIPAFDESYGLDFLCVYADDLDYETGASFLKSWIEGVLRERA